MTDFIEIAKNAKAASLHAASLDEKVKNSALEKIAEAIEAAKEEIFEANKTDLELALPLVENGELSKATFNRLKLDENKMFLSYRRSRDNF